VTENFPTTAPTPRFLPAAVSLALAATFTYRISIAVADPDLYHQLSLAREALRAGTVPRVDMFAFTPTHPIVVHHEWGAALVAHFVATTLGGPGILALRYALAGVIAALSLRTARRGGADGAAIAIAAPVAILIADWGFSPARAQLYTFAGVAFTLACLERDRAGGRRWMAAHAVGLLVWANLHGGFVVSFLLLAAYALEATLARRPVRHVLVLAALETPVVVANPWGASYPAYLVRAIAMPRPRVAEWAPLLSPGVPAAHAIAFGLALLLFAYGLWHARPRVAAGLPIVALTASMAFRGHRFLPIFAIAWMATAPALLARTPLAELVRSGARQAPRALAAAAGALALVMILLLSRARPWSLSVPNAAPSLAKEGLAYPVGATRFLRASGFRGRLMTTFETGAYVSWKLHPEVLVSLDGRYEAAYPEQVFTDVMAFYEGTRAPAEALARYAPDAVLLPRPQYALRAAIAWPAVYDDGAFAVLIRPGLALASITEPISTEDQFP
jgi:hypothetical protein